MDAARRSKNPQLLLAVAAFLCVVAILSYRMSTKLDAPDNIASGPNPAKWGLVDFRDAIYYPVVAFVEGKNPYEPSDFVRSYPVANTFPLYLPLTLLVHLPLGLLPLKVAQIAYYALTVATTLALAFLTLRICALDPTTTRLFGLATLMLISRPGHWNLILGQCAATVAAGAYVALYLARRRPMLAGLGVAVTTLKPTFGIPLAVLMLAQGTVRPVAIGLGLSALLSIAAAGVIAHNTGGIEAFIASLEANQAGFAADPQVNPATAPFRVDAVALIGRLLRQDLPAAAEFGVIVGILGIAAVALRQLNPSSDSLTEDATDRMSAGIICLATLACTYHQAYDLLLLAMPLTAVATGRWAPTSPGSLGQWPYRILLVSLTLLAFNYLTSGTAIRWLGITGHCWVAVASLNGTALLVALGIYTGCALRHAHQSPKSTVALPAHSYGARKT